MDLWNKILEFFGYSTSPVSGLDYTFSLNNKKITLQSSEVPSQLSTWYVKSAEPTKEVVLYYGNYSIYGSNYQIDDISWNNITELVYAFAMVGNSLHLFILKEKLNGKFLSFTIGANPNIVEIVQKAGESCNRSFWKEIAEAVDKLNIMTYDYHGTFDSQEFGTGFHSALYADPKKTGDIFNIDNSMKAFSAAFGVDNKHKLMFGAAAYGRAYKLKDFDKTKFDSYKPSEFLYKPFENEATWCRYIVIKHI